MLYPMIWAYRMNFKTSTEFLPFHIVHGAEALIVVECEIPSLKFAIHVLPYTYEIEECLLHLEHLDEHHSNALTKNKADKQRVKNQYDKAINS